MTIRERIESVDGIKQWSDSIPLHYEYTAGVAGEMFLRALMRGKITAGFCSHCKEKSLPPRIYCVECYEPIRRYVEVVSQGRVAAITVDNSRAEPAVSFVYVAFEGVRGGILHRLVGKAKLGDAVKPKFKPKGARKGSILDIEGFQKSGK